MSKIYSINDPNYRGVLFIPQETLRADRAGGRRVAACSSPPTASATGPSMPCSMPTRKSTRRRRSPRPGPCITHSNFMSREAIDKAAEAGRRGRHSAGLALSRHADAGGPVRRRPAALFPAAQEPLRGRRDRRRRLRPHAEDRLAPVGQPVQPVPGHVGHDHPQAQVVRAARCTPKRR